MGKGEIVIVAWIGGARWQVTAQSGARWFYSSEGGRWGAVRDAAQAGYSVNAYSAAHGAIEARRALEDGRSYDEGLETLTSAPEAALSGYKAEWQTRAEGAGAPSY